MSLWKNTVDITMRHFYSGMKKMYVVVGEYRGYHDASFL